MGYLAFVVRQNNMPTCVGESEGVARVQRCKSKMGEIELHTSHQFSSAEDLYLAMH